MADEQKSTQRDGLKFHQMPGMFESWEIGMMLDENVPIYVQKAGVTDAGDPLFAIFESGYICNDCREKATS